MQNLCSLAPDDCEYLEFLVSVRELSYCLRRLKTYTNKAFKEKYSHKLYFKVEPVPRSKHSVSVIKTNQSMLYSEIIAVCSQIHTKQINTLCGQKVELLNVKLAVPYSDHWADLHFVFHIHI